MMLTDAVPRRCLRCGGQLMRGDDGEPACLQCGEVYVLRGRPRTAGSGPLDGDGEGDVALGLAEAMARGVLTALLRGGPRSTTGLEVRMKVSQASGRLLARALRLLDAEGWVAYDRETATWALTDDGISRARSRRKLWGHAGTNTLHNGRITPLRRR